jgi:preprotein translocase subunit YajC
MSLLVPIVIAAFIGFYFLVWRSSKRSRGSTKDG